MVKPLTVKTLGNNLQVVMDDGTAYTAVATQGELFVVSDAEPPKPPDPPKPTTRFIWPFSLSLVTSEFGQRWGRLHAGIDFGNGAANVTGTPIPASSSGRVIVAGWHSGYGNAVVIDHGNGLHTLYGHMFQSPSVSVGQTVTQGQTLGGIGNTGNSFGNHLHFETHEGGYNWNESARDPRIFIPKWNK